MHRHWWQGWLLFVLAAALLVGCGQDTATKKTQEHVFFQGTDVRGKTVTLTKKPERIVLLSPSMLGIMEAVGGDYVAWAETGNDRVTERAKDKPKVGHLAHPNAEAIVAANPDLVIGYGKLHGKLAQVLEANHIPVYLLNLTNYDDVCEAIRLCGAVSGNNERAAAVQQELARRMQQEIVKAPREPVRVAILFGTSQAVTLDYETSIASDVARRLGFTDVFAGRGQTESARLAPFSLEALAAADPDVILLRSMARHGESDGIFDKALLDQPAWATLRAVRNGRVYRLPQELFTSNPGIDYPKSVRYMADIVGGHANSGEECQ